MAFLMPSGGGWRVGRVKRGRWRCGGCGWSGLEEGWVGRQKRPPRSCQGMPLRKTPGNAPPRAVTPSPRPPHRAAPPQQPTRVVGVAPHLHLHALHEPRQLVADVARALHALVLHVALRAPGGREAGLGPGVVAVEQRHVVTHAAPGGWWVGGSVGCKCGRAATVWGGNGAQVRLGVKAPEVRPAGAKARKHGLAPIQRARRLCRQRSPLSPITHLPPIPRPHPTHLEKALCALSACSALSLGRK